MMNHKTECPGCGLILPDKNLAPHEYYNASGECWELKGELTAYNMTSGDPTFIHQHCVDAYGAQHTGSQTKVITTLFALVGLCLAVEYHFTGKQVQHAHMNFAKPAAGWPSLNPPHKMNELTILDVLNCEPGKPRDRMIKEWATYVWNSWRAHHDTIRALCKQHIKDERIQSLLR